MYQVYMVFFSVRKLSQLLIDHNTLLQLATDYL